MLLLEVSCFEYGGIELFEISSMHSIPTKVDMETTQYRGAQQVFSFSCLLSFIRYPGFLVRFKDLCRNIVLYSCHENFE